jgi:hypothetical protein
LDSDVSDDNPHEEIHGAYTVTWEVVDNAPQSGTKLITVTTTWKEGNATRTAELMGVMPSLGGV